MGEAGRSGDPTVSVVIPVWNTEPWLRQCLDSVLAQTIGRERLEIVAVDDGSTDGSGAMLDAYAEAGAPVRVLHQANSGGPGAPRNRGLEIARGTYVFFLDSDDYLGPEALERLVAMAERNGSDIVLGKVVGVEGRRVYRDAGAFRCNRDRADLELVYHSGNVLKLFRRSMLEREDLRFVEGLAGGEDGDFMARAYPAAGTISVVADYDCYFTRRRRGSQTWRPDRRDDIAAYLARVERNRIRPVTRHAPPGLRRDIMILRHIRKVTAKLGAGWAARPEDERRAAFDVAAGIVERWCTPRIARALPAAGAIRVHCLTHGLFAELSDIAAVRSKDAYRNPLAEHGRAYARLPHFRDAAGIPDRCFDITHELVVEQRVDEAALAGGRLTIRGEAYLHLAGGTAALEIARWPTGPRHRLPTTVLATPLLRDKRASYPAAGFEAVVDLATAAAGAPLASGTWTLHVVLTAGGVERRTPLVVGRRSTVHAGQPRRDGATLVTTPDHELRLSVGRPSHVHAVLVRIAGPVARLRRLGRRGTARVLRATRPGRLLVLGVESVNPGLAAKLDRD